MESIHNGICIPLRRPEGDEQICEIAWLVVLLRDVQTSFNIGPLYTVSVSICNWSFKLFTKNIHRSVIPLIPANESKYYCNSLRLIFIYYIIVEQLLSLSSVVPFRSANDFLEDFRPNVNAATLLKN